MDIEDDACYEALKAKDARFDGMFFVGVASTGIYCRCVCRARTPRRDHCSFFRHAAEAEREGFRPCLLCRPEIAPSRSGVGDSDRLANRALRLIEEGGMSESNVDELAASLGVSGRHLRRVMGSHFGVSPTELAQTQRLLLAKRLLTDTVMPVGEIAFASGFRSLRRFNALFSERYRMAPTAMRRSVKSEPGELTLKIAYRPPYDFASLLAYFSVRAIPGVEQVTDGSYRRTVELGERRGWLELRQDPARNVLLVTLPEELAASAPRVLRRLRHQFDADAQPDAICDRLGELAAGNPGQRLPGAFDGFEVTIRAILGQQVSVRGATTLAGRLVERFGERVETPHAGLERLFPRAAVLAEADEGSIAGLGIVGARARAIIALSSAVASGEIALSPLADPHSTILALKALPGIGEWTAQYAAMRALAWPDAFPAGDLGVRKALGGITEKQALALAEAWRPWRAYAVMHLWRSLS